MVSDYWSFRSDRAALPAVFAWNDGTCGALCTDETSELGLTGSAFAGTRRHGDLAGLPVPRGAGNVRRRRAAEAGGYRYAPAFEPGRQVTLKLNVYAAGADPHAYDPFVRQMYRLHETTSMRCNPWMGLDEAAELTAYGLYTWHYDKPSEGILNETAAFDREFNNNVKGMGDRPICMSAGSAGHRTRMPCSLTGGSKGIAAYAEAGAAVLDKIAGGVSPSGIFWASWVAGKGWTAGWNPKSDWLQARTIAEATLFMTRALAFERERGDAHPEWEAAVRSNLDFAASRQREDGNFGSYYNCMSGEVEEWDGAGGMLWIPALLAGAAYFEETRYSEAAVLRAATTRNSSRTNISTARPEDVHLTPTSEDAYNAVVSYVHLYEFDRNPRWLALASSAADWMMTFRWTYNLQFPRHTLLRSTIFVRGARIRRRRPTSICTTTACSACRRCCGCGRIRRMLITSIARGTTSPASCSLSPGKTGISTRIKAWSRTLLQYELLPAERHDADAVACLVHRADSVRRRRKRKRTRRI